MLLGEDFGGRHQRRLVAGLDRVQHGQRGDHCLAAADVALQQALHRMRLFKVGGNFAPCPALRAGEAKGQRLQQGVGELRGGQQLRRAARATGQVSAAQAQLLGQQLVELHPPPGREVACLERRLRNLRRRVVEEADSLGDAGQSEPLHEFRRQRFAKVDSRQRLFDQAAQGALAQAGGGRIHRRQAFRQGFVVGHRVEARVDDLGAEVALVHLAKNTQAHARLQHLLLAGVEVEEPQRKSAAGIAHPRDQLPARPVGDLAVHHIDFELRSDAGAGVGQRCDAGLVLVAQRQMEREVGVALEAEPGQAAGEGIASLRRLFFSQERERRPPRPGRRAAVP